MAMRDGQCQGNVMIHYPILALAHKLTFAATHASLDRPSDCDSAPETALHHLRGGR